MGKIVTWLRHIAAVEPVYVRSIFGAIVTAASAWGVELSGITGPIETTLQQVIVVAGLTVTVLGIRDRVTPTAAVVARVQDPSDAPTEAVYLAGGYCEAPTGAVVDYGAALNRATRLGVNP